MLSPGATLRGRYRIDVSLGPGRTSTVYRGQDTALGGRAVAIKEMQFSKNLTPERAVAQFFREAGSLARLDHPSLVTVTDFFEERGCAFMVMSLVEGRTLAEVTTEGPVSVTQAVDWMNQMCDALAYLHALDPPYMFRDLDPSHVMLDAWNRVRLVGFGLSRTLAAGGRTAPALRGSLTPGFAPLEQYAEEIPSDPRSDIYSLGATMYALLTRAVPPDPVLLTTGEARLIPLRTLRADITPALEAVLLRMLAVQRGARHRSVEEVRQELSRAMASEAPSMVAPPLPALPLLPQFCSHCGAVREPQARWCTHCGAPLAVAEEPTVTPGNPSIVTPGNPPTVTPGNTPTVTPGPPPTVTPGNAPTVTPTHAQPRNRPPANTPPSPPLARPPLPTRPRPHTRRPARITHGPPPRPIAVPACAPRRPPSTPRPARIARRVDAHGHTVLRPPPPPPPTVRPSRVVAPSPELPQVVRRVVFPGGTSLGTLQTRGPSDEHWVDLVEASGLIPAPAEKWLGLRVARHPDSLHPLDTLEPDDLVMIDLTGTGISEDDLEPLRHHRGLREVRAGDNTLGDNGLSHLQGLPLLEILDLHGTQVGDGGTRVLAGFRYLRSLSLARTRVGDEGVASLRGSLSLEELDLSYTRITDASLPVLADVPWLRRVSLAHCLVGAHGLGPLVHLVDLRHLDLSGTAVSDGDFGAIGHRPLLSLGLADTEVSDAGLAQIVGLQHLENLDVGGSRVKSAGLAHLASLAGLRTLRLHKLPLSGTLAFLQPMAHLQKLDLSRGGVTRLDLVPVGLLPRLRDLDLGGNAIDDADLDLLGTLHELRSLGLNETRVSGRGLAALSRLRHLRALNLRGCPLDSLGFTQPLLSLETLVLRGTPLHDRALSTLRSVAGLRHLDLSDTGITDSALDHLKHLPMLQKLELGNTRVQGKGLESLRDLRHLRELDLSRCRLVDVTLRHLRGLERLRRLDLSHNRLTRHGLASLPALPLLEELNLKNTGLRAGDCRNLPDLPALRSLVTDG